MVNFNITSKKRASMLSIDSPRTRHVETDWDDIQRNILYMKEQSAVPISALMGKDEVVFRSLVENVKILYETPDEYSKFHRMVVDSFENQEDIAPGTVAAYFGGCLASSTISPRGCSAICAGSVPLASESEDGNSHCEHPVLLSNYTGRGFTFTQMNQATDTERAFVFINSATVEDFPGFTAGEKTALTEKGITEIRLMYYDGTKNIELGDWMGIQQIKDRIANVTSDITESISSTTSVIKTTATINTSMRVIGVLLIIILIIVLIYMASKMTSKKKK